MSADHWRSKNRCRSCQNTSRKRNNLAVHYNSSNQDAESLSNELNGIRANSTLIFGNLTSDDAVEGLIPDVLSKTGRLDVLINNASTFYPTPIDDITHDDWDSLIGTNLKAPMFLCKQQLT